MKMKTTLTVGLLLILLPSLIVLSTRRSLAQDAAQNPTPIVISLTPPGAEATPTTAPSSTPENGLSPDRFEPNDSPETATSIGMQSESGLTLIGEDVDAFTGLLKAGQILQVSTTVYEQLDTRIILYWQGQQVAENDDRSPTDVGSSAIFAAPADGRYVALVTKATPFDGVYDLQTSLLAPTATPTALPTQTSTPTATIMPSPTPLIRDDAAEPNDHAASAAPIVPGARNGYTVGAGDVDYFTFIAKAGAHYVCETITEQVDTHLELFNGDVLLIANDDRDAGRIDSSVAWSAQQEQAITVRVSTRGGSYGAYELLCAAAPPPPLLAPPGPIVTPRATATLTETAIITDSAPLTLTVRHLGRVEAQDEAPLTTIRLLVYYDANNDRTPGPNEGIPNLSVLAVDGRGQRLARVFTNAQGEAYFYLSDETVARVIVPFVPAWSARVQAGEANEEIVLGLPAVRLPVLFPVSRETGAATN